MREFLSTFRGMPSSNILLVAWIWFRVATPQVRFPVLATMQFEKVLFAMTVLTLATRTGVKLRKTRVWALYLTLYGWLLLSYVSSAFAHTTSCQFWIAEYWKDVLLFVVMVLALQSGEQVKQFAVALGLSLLLYQAHALVDFARGGAYVYQQGTRRLIAVWAAEGMGAPNAHGLASALTLPFCGLLLFSYRQHFPRLLGLAGGAMSLLSVVLTGTRGALLAVALLGVFQLRRWREVLVLGLIAAGLALVLWYALPPVLKYRYLGFIGAAHGETDKRVREIHDEGVKGRIVGLIDGWKLGIENPLLGVGPGASARARQQITEDDLSRRQEMQLHSLYGQIVAEGGFVGAALFVLLIVAAFQPLRITRSSSLWSRDERVLARFSGNTLAVYLAYGLAAHLLHSYYLCVALGISSAVASSLGQSTASVTQESDSP